MKQYKQDANSFSTLSLDITGDKPMDVRSVVPSYSDLLLRDTWKPTMYNGTKKDFVTCYAGMVVATANDGHLYVYVPTNGIPDTDYQNTESWVEVGSDATISTLRTMEVLVSNKTTTDTIVLTDTQGAPLDPAKVKNDYDYFFLKTTYTNSDSTITYSAGTTFIIDNNVFYAVPLANAAAKLIWKLLPSLFISLDATTITLDSASKLADAINITAKNYSTTAQSAFVVVDSEVKGNSVSIKASDELKIEIYEKEASPSVGSHSIYLRDASNSVLSNTLIFTIQESTSESE